MTRRILAFLLPAGLAAQVKQKVPMWGDGTQQSLAGGLPALVEAEIPQGVGGTRPKPKPGECPICATMAPPYKRTKGTGFLVSDERCDGKPSQPKECITWYPGTKEDWPPREVTCSWCRVKFVQDAEP